MRGSSPRIASRTITRLRERRAPLSRRRGNADRTAHARAAEAAIAHRILRQILLMVVLGKMKCSRAVGIGVGRPGSASAADGIASFLLNMNMATSPLVLSQYRGGAARAHLR